MLGERKGQRARRNRIFFFVISDLYELEKREEDDVCVYNKKEMFVYHHPKDVVLGDCCDGELEREGEEMRRERSDSIEVMQLSSAQVRDAQLHDQSGLPKI